MSEARVKYTLQDAEKVESVRIKNASYHGKHSLLKQFMSLKVSCKLQIQFYLQHELWKYFTRFKPKEHILLQHEKHKTGHELEGKKKKSTLLQKKWWHSNYNEIRYIFPIMLFMVTQTNILDNPSVSKSDPGLRPST